MKRLKPFSLLLCLSSLVPSISCAQQQPKGAYTATLYQVPVQPQHTPSISPPSPVELAVLSYDPADPSLSKIISFHPPPAPPGVDPTTLTPDNITANDPHWNHKTQILTYLHSPSTSSILASKDTPYRTSATSTLSLLPAFFPHGRFRLLISDPSSSSSRGSKEAPIVLGASFHGRLPPSQPQLTPVQAKRQAREQKERKAEQERERLKAARKAKRAGQKVEEEAPASAGAGVGAGSVQASAGLKKKPDSKGAFDLLVQSEAKGPVFDRPPRKLLSAAGAGQGGEGAGGAGTGAGEGAEGEEGEEVEKSFLQK